MQHRDFPRDQSSRNVPAQRHLTVLMGSGIVALVLLDHGKRVAFIST
jgi:hypothetical protein